MAYFTQDYIDFFTELEQNNVREWFQENKKRYEGSVKKPFNAFVTDLIGAMQSIYPELSLQAKDAIFRINRDIRFSADKSPYKIHMSAFVSPWGKKDHTHPGMYLQANHNDIRVYSGMHSVEPKMLKRVREHIVANLDRFNELVTDTSFTDVFGEILGDKHKRLTGEVAEASTQQPLLYNKSFYYYFKQKPETMLKDDLIDELVGKFRKALPLNEFFLEALSD